MGWTMKSKPKDRYIQPPLVYPEEIQTRDEKSNYLKAYNAKVNEHYMKWLAWTMTKDNDNG